MTDCSKLLKFVIFINIRCCAELSLLTSTQMNYYQLRIYMECFSQLVCKQCNFRNERSYSLLPLTSCILSVYLQSHRPSCVIIFILFLYFVDECWIFLFFGFIILTLLFCECICINYVKCFTYKYSSVCEIKLSLKMCTTWARYARDVI